MLSFPKSKAMLRRPYLKLRILKSDSGKVKQSFHLMSDLYRVPSLPPHAKAQQMVYQDLMGVRFGV